jgi:hypothetical protein
VTPARTSVAVVDVVARSTQQLHASSKFVGGKRARGPFDTNAQRAVHHAVIDSSIDDVNAFQNENADVIADVGVVGDECAIPTRTSSAAGTNQTSSYLRAVM